MKQVFVGPFVVLVVIFCLVGFIKLTISLFEQNPQELLGVAYDNYLAGEKALTVEQRQEAFNHSIEAYAALEDRYHPTMGNGKLYYNMANTFYQLEAYPWAVFDGYRARDLRPRDEKVLASLNHALKKLNLPIEKEPDSFVSRLFSYFKLSIPETIQFFTASVAIALLAFSIHIWRPRRLWRGVGVAACSLTSLLLLCLAYSYYLAPVEGVLIRSSLLYRDAGKQYAPVSEDPVPSGQKVEILETSGDRKWHKVQIPTGTVGFVPIENLRTIR